MYKENIDPNRALFLARTNDGWIVAKPFCFSVVSDDAMNFSHYEINHSIFYINKVPQELIDELFNLIPTDEMIDSGWKSGIDTLNYFD